MFLRFRICRFFPALALVAAASFSLAQDTASAEGWWDRVQDVYHMPEELDRMQERLTETVEASKEAAARFEEAQRKLHSENEALREQNAQLEARLEAANAELEARLRAAEEKEARRAAEAARWTKMAITGVALLAFYFVLARLIRLFVWRKGRSDAAEGGRS
ncbi:hypothetical protein MO973_07760 [Paenibacillus sp. TRM 82003]|nr:hypothetical protein [Paenibacillus sp. TRM 82003]